MKDFLPITIQLSPKEGSILLAEAQKRNLSPDVFASQLLKNSIAQIPDFKHQAALDALVQLDELVSRLPLVDAVELARSSREELEQRSEFCQ
ncbi:MAG: hypothetical protein KME21_18070 [Desmonostoc vinosum HA7617-LM4]|jgi:hypothetical protein|nr:hypothetical protein [Desmonostoc vinosum HA7617-LM4]